MIEEHVVQFLRGLGPRQIPTVLNNGENHFSLVSLENVKPETVECLKDCVGSIHVSVFCFPLFRFTSSRLCCALIVFQNDEEICCKSEEEISYLQSHSDHKLVRYRLQKSTMLLCD